MAKFHVNPATLEPGRCRAQKSCPFGDESEHFSTIGEARNHAETKLSEVMNTFSEKGDFSVGEEVILGENYDTSGRPATVVEVEKDSVKLKSYDDGETYWVPKEFLTDPKSGNYVSRKDSLGNFVSAETAFGLQAVKKLTKFNDALGDLTEAEKAELDELWSEGDSEAEKIRGKAYQLAKTTGRAAALESHWGEVRKFGQGNIKYFGAAEAVQDAMLAELVEDKLTPEEYFALAKPVFQSSSKLKSILD